MGKSNEEGVNNEPVVPPFKKIKVECDIAQESTLIVNEGQPKFTLHLNNRSKIEGGLSDQSQPKKVDFVCSGCKYSKMKTIFSPAQRKKGENGGFATCKNCSWMDIEKQRSLAKNRKKTKELRQREIQAENKMMESLKQRMCAACNATKRKEEFDKGQQRIGKKAQCRKCIQERERKGLEASKIKKAQANQTNRKRSRNNVMCQPEVNRELNSGESSCQLGTYANNFGYASSLGGSNNAPGMVKSVFNNEKNKIHNKGAKFDVIQRVKKKTTTTETELDDGTSVVETETIETHPDGTTVKTIKKESTLQRTTNLPDGSQSIEKMVNTSITEMTTKIGHAVTLPK